MKEDTTVVPFRHADSIEDPLTEIAREGARRMLAAALKAEADAFVASFADDVLPVTVEHRRAAKKAMGDCVCDGRMAHTYQPMECLVRFEVTMVLKNLS